MSTDDLLTGGDIARLLGFSRQRLSQLRDSEEFPAPTGRIGSAHVWRWADVESWLETRRGDRPKVHPSLERRARQLERLGYRVSVTRDDHRFNVGENLLEPSGLWSARISMRGNLSVASEREHEDPSAALRDALMHFDKVAGRQFTDRDTRARIQELLRRGWREGEGGGLLADTTGEWWTYRLDAPDGGESITRKGDTPLEAKRQVVELAEARQAEIDGRE